MARVAAKLFGILVIVATQASPAAAWIPIRSQPRGSIIRALFNLQRTLPQRRLSSLAISRRDLDALRNGDDDPEEKAAAEAAAASARSMLERMWASSGASNQESFQVEEPATTISQSEEARRENLFPSSTERGALEAGTACLKALLDGKRGLVIDVEVRQLEEGHSDFDPTMLVQFVGELAKSLASMSGRVKTMYKGDEIVQTANELLQEWNEEAMERGMDPREDMGFCSYLSPVKPDDEGYLEQITTFADKVTEQMAEDDRLFILTTPKNMGDVAVVRKVIEAAKGRPVVLINPRMSFMPLELSDFDTVYLLKQFSVVPVKTDMQNMARRSPFKITKAQRHRQHIESQLGQTVPKVITHRAYPDEYKLYVDCDGQGFELIETYERKPMAPTLCLRAQMYIGQRQREVMMEERKQELQRMQEERLKRYGDTRSEEGSSGGVDSTRRD